MASVFYFRGCFMRNKAKFLTYGAVLAAAYVTLTHLQNVLLPGTASNMIQVRIAEALCVFAFFTPAAIPGLSLGCLLFNLTFAGSLPLDFLVGSLATFLRSNPIRTTDTANDRFEIQMFVVHDAVRVHIRIVALLRCPRCRQHSAARHC